MTAPDRARGPVEIPRRTFLKTAGVAGAAAGLEGILAARRAPAFAQATKIHLLQWVDFIPEGDVEVRRQVVEYQKQTKVEVTFETINANDLQARITAAIQSGSGPDIIMMLHNWPHLYAGGLADVNDLADWKASDQGGYYPHSAAAARVGNRWLGLPYFTGAPLIAYRKSWFAEVGAPQPPKTLEEYKKIGAALKKKGKPIGQTLGHTFGDAPAWTYPFTWTFGGAETDPSGKKVVLNSKGTVEAVTWMTDFWKQACDESALAWDDTNNNRAFHAGEISATLNGASIYIYAKRNPDKIKDEKGEPMWPDIGHLAIPDGPGGRTPP
jgi:multiple sugar transport system substrate-binding protein